MGFPYPVTLEDLYNGKEDKYTFKRSMTCSACEGFVAVNIFIRAWFSLSNMFIEEEHILQMQKLLLVALNAMDTVLQCLWDILVLEWCNKFNNLAKYVFKIHIIDQ